MKKEFSIYPFRHMNITQRHDQGNHTSHWQGVTNWSDKPWDEACKDGGKRRTSGRKEYKRYIYCKRISQK